MKTYLAHHGILGQKWGIRRYENKDGTLTEAGKKRYGVIRDLEYKSAMHEIEETRRYKESEEGKEYKKWKKKNPYADEDDFGDYMADKNIKSFQRRTNQYQADLDAIKGKNYVQDVVITSAVSAFYLAPLTALIVGAKTKSGKAAALAYLGTIGALDAYSLATDRKEQVATEKKYGLR